MFVSDVLGRLLPFSDTQLEANALPSDIDETFKVAK
jgi:hypothetical protein